MPSKLLSTKFPANISTYTVHSLMWETSVCQFDV